MRKLNATEEAQGLFPLLEEGAVLLRQVPAAAWACHLLGTGPFVLAFVRFWAVFSGGSARADLFGWAFLLSGLHVWMRVWQSRFGAILLDVRHARAVSAWSLAEWRRAAVNQLLYGMPCFVGMVPAAVMMIPFGWMLAFYQNLAVSAHEADGAGRAWGAARYAPLQNHLLIGGLSAGWMVLFFNVFAVLCMLPFAIRWLVPVEWVFMRNSFWFLNSTFLCAAVSFTYLLFDPLVKAVYALRVFYGLSCATGEDLRTDWRRLRAASAVALALVLAAGAARAAPQSDALAAAVEAVPVVAVAPPDGAVGAGALESALAAAADDARYVWRRPVDLVPHDGGWFERNIVAPIEKLMKRVGQWLEKVSEFFRKLSSRDDMTSGRTSSGSGGISQSALWWCIAVAVALAGGLLLFMLWRLRRQKAGVGQAVAVRQAAATPDVSDESVTAEVLPEDEWLRLVDRFCAEGEYRKAARACFLACLACLAKRDWIALRRSKTNADYLREMRRRARGRVFDERPFCDAVGLFEAGWYGEHPVTAEVLGALRLSVEAYRHG